MSEYDPTCPVCGEGTKAVYVSFEWEMYQPSPEHVEDTFQVMCEGCMSKIGAFVWGDATIEVPGDD